MQIKLFEDYQEDPRFKNPKEYIKGMIEEYQTILTDENQIRLYNISYQIYNSVNLVYMEWERRWRQVLMDYANLTPRQHAEAKRQLDKDIENLNYRIQVRIVLKIQQIDGLRNQATLHSVGGKKISLPTPPSKLQRLELLPDYQEFMDRISNEVEEFFVVEDMDANIFCQTSDDDNNILDNRIVYFYPKGCKALSLKREKNKPTFI